MPAPRSAHGRSLGLIAGLLLVTSSVACTPRATTTQAHTARAKSGPRTVVAAVVVDQLGAWVLEMHRARWEHTPLGDPACGGFCRLMREGVLHTRMEYAHAITDTAPGHASLFTGVPPREHGITQNEKAIDDPTRPSGYRAVGVLYDPAARLVTKDGVSDSPGPSLAELRVPTVADQLRTAEPDACIVSVSLKDRAALFGGGRSPTLTAFYEPATRGFVTSSAFAKVLPAQATLTFAPGELEGRTWTPLDRSFLEKHATTADDQPGEGDYHGLGSTFPHPLAGRPGTADPKPEATYRMSPFGDTDVRAVGQRALGLCHDARTVLVSLSFSSHDYVLHGYGAHSWEAFDELNRLDHTLGLWLDDLDATFGKGAWSLALAADHGSIPLPELAVAKRPWCAAGAANPWDLPCAAGVRLAAGKLAVTLEERAERELGPGPWIGAVTDPRIVLSTRARQLPAAGRAKLLKALEAELLATGGVERVVDLTRPLGDCGAEPLGADTADLVQRSVCWSQTTARAGTAQGDLYVVVKKGSFFDAGYTLGRGESHGSPWLYDRAVPLLLRPADSRSDTPRNTVSSTPISFRTFAGTLREWLGLHSN